MKTDKIIWLDGHTTTADSEEMSRKMVEVATDTGSKWHIIDTDFELVWKGNCWMQIK